MKSIKYGIKLLHRAFMNVSYLDDMIPSMKQQINNRVESLLVKFRMEECTFHSQEKGTTEEIVEDTPLVISLTTHGKRIETVFHTIESIFQQTLKANRVILWLGDKEFSCVEELPLSLRIQMERGLDIRFVKDVRSYTKLIPALKEFPNANIVTIDDDFMYPRNLLERLWNGHKSYPNAIISVVSREMQLVDGHSFMPFNTFSSKDRIEDYVSPMNLLEGFAGVLYPPGVFDDEVLNEQKFLQLAPHADDIWFTAMAIKAKTPIVQIKRNFGVYHEMYQDDDVQDIALANTNVSENKNDVQLKAVFDEYNLYSLLNES